LDKSRDAAFEPNDPGKWGVFATGLYMTHHRDDVGDHGGYTGRTSGAQAGVDWRARRDVRAGLAVAYTHTDLGFNDGLGDARTNTYRIGPYVSYGRDGWFIDASLSYALHAIDQRRRIDTLGVDAEVDRDAHEIVLGVQGGFTMPIDRWRITPTAAVEYSLYHAPGYDEHGAGLANLHVDSRTEHDVVTRLGASASVEMAIGELELTPTIGAAWRHQWTDATDRIDARLEAGGGTFSVEALGPSRDAAVVHAAVAARLNDRWHVSGGYQAWLSGDDQSHAIHAGLRADF